MIISYDGKIQAVSTKTILSNLIWVEVNQLCTGFQSDADVHSTIQRLV